jgi:hypothetical protein
LAVAPPQHRPIRGGLGEERRCLALGIRALCKLSARRGARPSFRQRLHDHENAQLVHAVGRSLEAERIQKLRILCAELTSSLLGRAVAVVTTVHAAKRVARFPRGTGGTCRDLQLQSFWARPWLYRLPPARRERWIATPSRKKPTFTPPVTARICLGAATRSCRLCRTPGVRTATGSVMPRRSRARRNRGRRSRPPAHVGMRHCARSIGCLPTGGRRSGGISKVAPETKRVSPRLCARELPSNRTWKQKRRRSTGDSATTCSPCFTPRSGRKRRREPRPRTDRARRAPTAAACSGPVGQAAACATRPA